MKASVVIGANYGDEGKGLMTDFLCRKYNADMVVRFNGGAQAGHTVVTPEGNRHVFSHIGSGYFAGVPTFLSKYFVLNPIVFRKEFIELGVPNDYKIYVDPRCQITTIWDVVANQAKEEIRGDNRHGSCGLGFGETLERYENDNISCSISYDDIYKCLSRIKNYWQWRLPITLPWVSLAFQNAGKLEEEYLDDYMFMMKHITIKVPDFNYAIFEGAQGLGLDQFMGNFPYVTRSNTGMRNVVDMRRSMRFGIDEIVYVSRTYETRHGNDPEFEDGSVIPPEGCYDKTNAPNAWQGTLMYRELDYYNLVDRVQTDVCANNIDFTKPCLAFTHTDQIAFDKDAWDDCFLRWISCKYMSNGETHKNITEVCY